MSWHECVSCVLAPDQVAALLVAEPVVGQAERPKIAEFRLGDGAQVHVARSTTRRTSTPAFTRAGRPPMRLTVGALGRVFEKIDLSKEGCETNLNKEYTQYK